MKRTIIVILLLVGFITFSKAQKSELRNYILSYPILNNETYVNFQNYANRGILMSKKEALKYVYKNDSSKLICKGVVYSLEDEKVTDTWEKEILPKKCFRYEEDSLVLVVYSSNSCNPSVNIISNIVNMEIYDKDFNLKKNLIVYQGNQYDSDITSIINLKTLKFFLYKIEDNSQHFSLYGIDKKNLKFELIKNLLVHGIPSDNLIKVINRLKVDSLFNN